MRFSASLLIPCAVIAAFAAAATSSPRAVTDVQPRSVAQPQPAKDEKVVDWKADDVHPINYGDSTIHVLVGNFAAHHNGAVITCDSAVRVNDNNWEFFGDVLINKGSVYAYGERAEYDGAASEAHLYSRLVKVVDGKATLYTESFKFNTKTNIGEYDGGGTLLNGTSELESDRGYYNTSTHNIIGVGRVQMRNEEYELTGDSVVYNVQTDHARFYTNTNIWNKKGEYLYADRGTYDKAADLYTLTLNGYVLTADQELMSDTLDYYRDRSYVWLRGNIQIDDQKQKVLAFGDWGEYWQDRGDALLTRNPSMISYDKEQGDSLYMRSDSMFLYTYGPTRAAADRLREERDSLAKAASTESGEGEEPTAKRGSAGGTAQHSTAEAKHTPQGGAEHALAAEGSEPRAQQAPDSLAVHKQQPDSLAADSLARDSVKVLTKAEQKAKLKAEKEAAAAELRKQKAKALKDKLNEIADRRQAVQTARLRKVEHADSLRSAKVRAGEEARLRKSLARLARKGQTVKPLDEITQQKIDSAFMADAAQYDSLFIRLEDSLHAYYVPAIAADSLTDSLAGDTMYRVVRGYRNVRVYRKDFQAVCDSMVGSSADSILHMYIKPVLWNEQNQITSEVMHIYSKNGELSRGEFEGKPMTVAQIDTAHYNQVTGKSMVSFFSHNQIYRNDVNGNAQTIYYMQEDENSPEVTMMTYIESGSITFYIEEKKVVGITYRDNPTYTFFPIDKIPQEQPLFLEGFQWLEERRPSVEQVFDRTIRPSQRAEKEHLKRPMFPITERINRRRESLVRQHAWEDRTDTLTVETVEWRDNL